MAKEAGLFQKYGLDLDLQLISSGPTLISSLLAEEIDFADVGAPSPMNANLQGGDIVLITTTLDRPTLLVMAPNEIRQVADLRGKPVGVNRAGYIAAHPERVQNFVKATIEALQLLRTDRERTVSLLAKYAQITDRVVAEQSWEYLRERWVMPPYPDRKAVETVIQEALVPEDPNARQIPPEAYYDDRFIRELEASDFIRQVTGR
jgi:ABC-type nitrate/sulfonate/bicarbonate transport system substrate-binding protein